MHPRNESGASQVRYFDPATYAVGEPARGLMTETKNHAAFIWSVTDLLRGDYKQSEYDITPPRHITASCGDAPCSEAVAIANAMFVHADDYALQQFATRINQISGYRSGQHIASRLARLAKVERPTRMRAQYPSLDDGRIIEPYEW